jgi:hypothetical protein
MVFSSSRTKCTATVLNSDVNHRRVLQLPVSICLLDILSGFQIVSTQSGEAQGACGAAVDFRPTPAYKGYYLPYLEG